MFNQFIDSSVQHVFEMYGFQLACSVTQSSVKNTQLHLQTVQHVLEMYGFS